MKRRTIACLMMCCFSFYLVGCNPSPSKEDNPVSLTETTVWGNGKETLSVAEMQDLNNRSYDKVYSIFEELGLKCMTSRTPANIEDKITGKNSISAFREDTSNPFINAGYVVSTATGIKQVHYTIGYSVSAAKMPTVEDLTIKEAFKLFTQKEMPKDMEKKLNKLIETSYSSGENLNSSLYTPVNYNAFKILVSMTESTLNISILGPISEGDNLN